MEILFLGSGGAWCVPEHSCTCAICKKMEELGEDRTRTSFVIKKNKPVLMDCGPDIRLHMRRYNLECPEMILITHEHGDHFLGLDDLLAYRRSMPAEAWKPIPVFAAETAWKSIETRFGYLLGSLLEKRTVEPGVTLETPECKITPFKTFHGPTAAGSVGYILEYGKPYFKIVYTSDFSRLEEDLPLLRDPDILIMQTHWLNQPEFNRPNHMSFQNAVDYIREWKPKKGTFLVHLSDGDKVPGDPGNSFMKKLEPKSPMTDPKNGAPYPIPLCQSEWQAVIDRICNDYDIPGPIIVTYDGFRLNMA
jgi:phosphoribosyl 1,2-cyclic phosphate phosphodiesterase